MTPPIGPLTAAVEHSVDALSLSRADEAVVMLARNLAQAIDEDPAQVANLGPQLLRTLEALGASPLGRSKLPADRGSHTNDPLTQHLAKQQPGGQA